LKNSLALRFIANPGQKLEKITMHLSATDIKTLAAALATPVAEALAERLSNSVFDMRYLRVEEAAVYLRVSPALLNKLRSKGPGVDSAKKLPFIKIGEAVVYDREDLDRWLEKNKQVIA
jgi:hypothetical protein